MRPEDFIKRIENMTATIEGVDLDAITVVDRDGAAWHRDDISDNLSWTRVTNAWHLDWESQFRVLAITPMHPQYGVKSETWESIRRAIRAYDGPIDWIISDGDNPHNRAYQNVTHQHNKARQMALDGGYDALLSIESDMIVPEDTVQRLIDLDADVAYGLYVFRHKGKRWSAYKTLSIWGGESYSLDHTGEDARSVWGKQINVAGVGMGVTMIRRNALKNMRFRLYDGHEGDWLIDVVKAGAEKAGVQVNPYRPHFGMLCDDYLMALDAAHQGFTQRCDLGLVCGHINGDSVLWPDPDQPKLYREETLKVPV